MDITFSAANAVGLNNPGTEIITLVKDGSGNFINPPSYDKMRAYLSSGEVPMLFVTDEAGETGSLCQLVEYSETENKIRFSNDVNTIEFSSGAVAPVVSDVVPKPLTYDYMPEGYPSKSVQTIVLMEEQEVAFSDMGGIYGASLTDAFDIVEGQTYTVNWDGTEYECVCRNNGGLYIGNPSISGKGEDSGEPFVYVSSMKTFASLDTSPSHTISVKTTTEVVTPMAEEFLPESVATKSDVEVAQTAADAAQTTATNAQNTANNAKNIASKALPLSGGVIQISGGGTVATLTLDEFTAAAGDAQKRGIQIGGSGAYGHNILEVTNKDITIYDSVAQKRVGGLNTEELFLKPKNSPKIFKITVDDSGTISATEVT